MSRYKSRDTIRNRLSSYRFRTMRRRQRVSPGEAVEGRSVTPTENSIITHYDLPVMLNPTKAERASLHRTKHVWRETDKFWKLAASSYGDASLWWIIAWYNQLPTESHLVPGDIIYIPNPINRIIQILRSR
jgi:nucleoid-associated protein YgaU